MEIIVMVMRLLPAGFFRVMDWAIYNWAVTMLALVGMIYWAGRQRRLNRHHL